MCRLYFIYRGQLEISFSPEYERNVIFALNLFIIAHHDFKETQSSEDSGQSEVHQQHKVCGGGFCSLKESTSNVLKGRLEEVIQGIFYFGLKSLLTDVTISLRMT